MKRLFHIHASSFQIIASSNDLKKWSSEQSTKNT